MLAELSPEITNPRTRQEMVAGKRALRRAGQVEYIETLCKQNKIRVKHDWTDVVRVEVLSEPPKKRKGYRYPDERYQGQYVTVTLEDAGKEFPSNRLITSLRMIFE